MLKRTIFACILLFFYLSSCTLIRDLDADPATNDNTLLVECYLEPDSLYRLALTRTVPYFVTLETYPTVENALVIISVNGVSDTLRYYPPLSVGNAFNMGEYRSANKVPQLYNTPFFLTIQHEGKTYTSQTKINSPVEMDTIYSKYFVKDEIVDSTKGALMLKWKTVNPDSINYFGVMSWSLRSKVKAWRYGFKDTNTVGLSHFRSAYIFPKHDTVYYVFYRMTKEHYDFFYAENFQRGSLENSNIPSNINGCLGIFAGLTSKKFFLITE